MSRELDSLIAAWREAHEAGLSEDTQTIRAFEMGGRAVLTLITEVLGDQYNQEKSALERLLLVSNVMMQANVDLGKLVKAIQEPA